MQQEMGCKQGRVKFRTFHTEFVSDPLGMWEGKENATFKDTLKGTPHWPEFPFLCRLSSEDLAGVEQAEMAGKDRRSLWKKPQEQSLKEAATHALGSAEPPASRPPLPRLSSTSQPSRRPERHSYHTISLFSVCPYDPQIAKYCDKSLTLYSLYF